MENRIIDYYYKDCSKADSNEVEEHLKKCPSCSKYYDEISSVLVAVTNTPVPPVSSKQMSAVIESVVGPVSLFQRIQWLLLELLSPAGHLLLPGLISGLLCALTLGPIMLGSVSIKMSSELLLASAVLWASVYTTLVSAILNRSKEPSATTVNLRILVYSVLAGCFLMNATLFAGIKYGFFSKYVVKAVSIRLLKALSLSSVFAIIVVSSVLAAFRDRHIIPTILCVIALYLAINIPVFFCIAGIALTLFSVLNYVGMVIAAGIAGILIGRMSRDIYLELCRRYPFEPPVEASLVDCLHL